MAGRNGTIELGRERPITVDSGADIAPAVSPYPGKTCRHPSRRERHDDLSLTTTPGRYWSVFTACHMVNESARWDIQIDPIG